MWWTKPPGQGYPHDVLRPNRYTALAGVPTRVISLSPGVCPRQLLEGLCSWGVVPLFPPSTLCQLGQDPPAGPSSRRSPRGGTGHLVPAPPPAGSGLPPRGRVRGEGLGPNPAGGVSLGGDALGHTPSPCSCSLCGPGQLFPAPAHPTASGEGRGWSQGSPNSFRDSPNCPLSPSICSWASAATRGEDAG